MGGGGGKATTGAGDGGELRGRGLMREERDGTMGSDSRGQTHGWCRLWWGWAKGIDSGRCRRPGRFEYFMCNSPSNEHVLLSVVC